VDEQHLGGGVSAADDHPAGSANDGAQRTARLAA